MTQRAPRRPPTATTPMTSFHCPPAPFPTTTLYYVTSLDHRHLICRAITAGGCVERCANCSPSNHARRDFLCRCRPRHLARHVGDNIAELCGILIFWRGNYRDKDMPRYDLNIAIFDTIRYIVCTCLERSPGLCQDVVIVYGAQTTAENATVQGILCDDRT